MTQLNSFKDLVVWQIHRGDPASVPFHLCRPASSRGDLNPIESCWRESPFHQGVSQSRVYLARVSGWSRNSVL